VTVSPETSRTTISAFTADSKGNPIPFTSGPYGGFVYLRANVSASSGFGIPTGSLYFAEPAPRGVIGGALALNSQGSTANPFGIFTLEVGAHSITGNYNGDASFNPSSSGPLNFTISQASTTTTASVVPNTQGAGAVLTAAIATTSYGNPPTGTVTFASGGTQLGSAQVVGGTNSTNATAQASVSITDSQMANGQYNITAAYNGDTNYTGSSSTPVALNLQPDFTFFSSPATGTVSAPGNVTYETLTVGALDGFNGAINFTAGSCAGLPAEASCRFAPASVAGSGTTSLTVATTAPHQNAIRGTSLSKNVNPWATSLGLAMAGIFLARVSSRRRRWCGLCSVLIIAFLIALPACGGGSGGGGGGGGGVTDPGTPVGTYTVTVTAASGSLTHTASFQLVVQ